MQATDYEVVSPDGQIKMIMHIDNGTTYEILHGETQLIAASPIGLNLSNGIVIGEGSVKSTQARSENNSVEVPIGKNKTLTDTYNELTITFNENYDLIVRAYNEGVAYRFVTALDGEIIINSEDAIFNFPTAPKVYFPECDTNTTQEKDRQGINRSIHQGFRNFERTYNIYNTPAAISGGKFAVTPVLYEYPNTNYKVVVTEADTYDYPGMYMERNGARSMRGMWAKYPKAVMDPVGGPDDDGRNYYSNHLVYEREDYIVKTNGARTFPWRVIIVSNDDKSLLNNNLVYLLAEPSRLRDISWIQPGKSAWEWWHKAMLEGVSFPVGEDNLSIQMYRYYIDWAAANGIEYMTFDAGYNESWVGSLCAYAKNRGVKIILWTWASCALEAPDDWIVKMKQRGVAGAKIDFFERNDQIAMTWGHRLAQKLADNQMVGIFHGCPVPTGLNRTFPNILNFEAVRGGEDNFWRSLVTPDYHTQFPFIRSLAGPEDYTPGSMRNKTAAEFYPVDQSHIVPMSMGTRAHELSMYVIFDHWLGYLCDAPTEYNKFPDILDFLSTVPTIWDQTVPLDAKLGEYILMAKQSGSNWYIGGMSNWESRDIEVDFSFLPPGITYRATILKDAPTSSTQPTQYVSETDVITKDSKLTFKMEKGGGFVIRLIDSTNTGLESMNELSDVSININKSTKTLFVSAEKAVQSVSLYNLYGQMLLNEHLRENTYAQTIHLSDLNRGAYIVKVETKETSISWKFIY
jgi:alpha-glucosidase